MMIDDAHSSGVLGRNGRGTVDHFDLHGRVDIQVGTLSKAVGALGGYVCSTRDTIDFLYHRARPFLFSTSHPPSTAASCLAAFEVLEEEPQLIQRLWDNTNFFKEGLKRLGFDTGMSETPITPVIVGDVALAHQFSRDLFEAGVFAQSIGFPTVPKGKARIRTIVTATHTRDELSRAGITHVLATARSVRALARFHGAGSGSWAGGERSIGRGLCCMRWRWLSGKRPGPTA